jgi:hypothetical protein
MRLTDQIRRGEIEFLEGVFVADPALNKERAHSAVKYDDSLAENIGQFPGVGHD